MLAANVVCFYFLFLQILLWGLVGSFLNLDFMVAVIGAILCGYSIITLFMHWIFIESLLCPRHCFQSLESKQ